MCNLYRIIIKGFSRNLTKMDMWQIEESESSEYLTQELEKHWNEVAQKYLFFVNIQYSTVPDRTKFPMFWNRT